MPCRQRRLNACPPYSSEQIVNGLVGVLLDEVNHALDPISLHPRHRCRRLLLTSGITGFPSSPLT